MTHHCHWPGCTVEVPPSRWGCLDHWQKLPRHLRQGIWSTYVPGQEIKKNPSPDYIAAAKAVREWVLQQQEESPKVTERTADLFGELPPPVDKPDPIAHVRHLPVTEQIKYAFARYVWLHRREMCPADYADKNGVRRNITWVERFELGYKQKLDDYIEFCKANYENRPKSQEPSCPSTKKQAAP